MVKRGPDGELHVGKAAAAPTIREVLQRHTVSTLCDGAGTLDEERVLVGDVTGDGHLDAVVAHDGLRCEEGEPLYCGAQVCSFDIFVNDGIAMHKKGNGLGLVRLQGKPPTIHGVGHGGRPFVVDWDGATFTNRLTD